MKQLIRLTYAAITASLVVTFCSTTDASAVTYQNYRHRTSSYDYLYSTGKSVFIDGTRPSSNSVKDKANWQIIYNGSYRLLKNSATGLCLDTNTARNVYTNPCSGGNMWQNWQVLYNGDYILFKNRQTGKCLDAGKHYVYTNTCSYGNYYMNWY